MSAIKKVKQTLGFLKFQQSETNQKISPTKSTQEETKFNGSGRPVSVKQTLNILIFQHKNNQEIQHAKPKTGTKLNGKVQSKRVKQTLRLLKFQSVKEKSKEKNSEEPKPNHNVKEQKIVSEIALNQNPQDPQELSFIPMTKQVEIEEQMTNTPPDSKTPIGRIQTARKTTIIYTQTVRENSKNQKEKETAQMFQHFIHKQIEFPIKIKDALDDKPCSECDMKELHLFRCNFCQCQGICEKCIDETGLCFSCKKKDWAASKQELLKHCDEKVRSQGSKLWKVQVKAAKLNADCAKKDDFCKCISKTFEQKFGFPSKVKLKCGCVGHPSCLEHPNNSNGNCAKHRKDQDEINSVNEIYQQNGQAMLLAIQEIMCRDLKEENAKINFLLDLNDLGTMVIMNADGFFEKKQAGWLQKIFNNAVQSHTRSQKNKLKFYQDFWKQEKKTIKLKLEDLSPKRFKNSLLKKIVESKTQAQIHSLVNDFLQLIVKIESFKKQTIMKKVFKKVFGNNLCKIGLKRTNIQSLETLEGKLERKKKV